MDDEDLTDQEIQPVVEGPGQNCEACKCCQALLDPPCGELTHVVAVK